MCRVLAADCAIHAAAVVELLHHRRWPNEVDLVRGWPAQLQASVCVCVSAHRAIGSSMTIGYHAQKGRGITANFSIGAAPTGAPTAGPTADPTADPSAGPTTAPSPVPTTLIPSVLAGFEFNVVLTPSITLYWCVSVCVCVCVFCSVCRARSCVDCRTVTGASVRMAIATTVTNAWVGVGFSPSGFMIGSCAVIYGTFGGVTQIQVGLLAPEC